MTQAEMNPYRYSDTNKRYMTFDYYIKHRFGVKLAKIPLDAGLTCPNCDGTKGTGGCIYCLNGSCDSSGASLMEQYQNGIARISGKWQPGGFIPYLQAHTNTYAPPNVLRAIYDEASTLPGAKMLAIATRADCLDDAVISELVRVSRKIPLLVELGLQSSDDRTAELINRGHTFAEFEDGYGRLRRACGDIAVCIHIIAGLPGEDFAAMMKTARDTAALAPDMVKIHLLHVLGGTKLGEMYRRGEYTPMTEAGYVSTVCSMIEVMPEKCVIARLTGDGIGNRLLAPMWSAKKVAVINDIDKEMYRRGTYQGIYETKPKPGFRQSLT